MTRQVSQREAARDFDGLVRDLRRDKAPIAVEDEGQVVAVMVDPSIFEAWERRAFFALIAEMGEQNTDTEPKEVLADVTREVEEVRRERYERRRG